MTEETRQTIVDTALRVGERFGVPVLILGVLLWFVYGAAGTIQRTVVEPVVAGHVEFLRSTSKTLEEIGTVQQQQADTLQEIAAGQRELQHAINSTPNTGARN